MTHPRTTLLEVRDLSIHFGSHTAVSGFDLAILEGETVALVGESGSGKSLTSLALMRLLPRTARMEAVALTLAGQDLRNASEKEMRRQRGRQVAMVFQEPMTSLNPVLTIGQQIGETIELHEGLSRKAAHARAVELLDLVRIPDPQRRANEYPHNLSGGMRQRVMIAIAVACSPKLLIADEPTTALDVTVQAQILDLLDDLRSRLSMGMLLVTHALGVVERYADRVVVMYAGRKVEEARSAGLFANPAHPYTRGLLAAAPARSDTRHYREGPLTELPGSVASARGQAGCPFAPRCALRQPDCVEAMPRFRAFSPGQIAACPHSPLPELIGAASRD